MTYMPEIDPDHKFRLGSGALAAIGALSLLVKQVADIIKDLTTKTANGPQFVIAAVFAALLFWSGGIVYDALRSRSRLRKPLDVLPTRPDHLIDRDEDIVKLEKLCRDAREVLLIGWAGAGKTAVLQNGLVPALAGKAALLPIYINWWAGEWSDGPLDLIATQLWTSLSTEAKTRLELSAPPNGSSAATTILKLKGSQGITPLIVLDDVEEYLAVHSRHFAEADGSPATPGRLAESSAFFHFLGELIRNNAGHVLIARAPKTPFPQLSEHPAKYSLERPTRVAVASYLEGLAGTGDVVAITHPERGWNQLCARVLDVIEENGRVLPRLISFIVRELQNFERLTPAELDLAGGVTGVARAAVERELVEIADLRGCQVATLHEVMRIIAAALEPLTLNAIAQELTRRGATELDAGTLTSVLQDLSGRQLLQALPSGDSAGAWTTKHKLITAGANELGNEPNRWVAMLKRGGERRGWRTLLRPSTQTSLFYHRLRGDFRYGAYRRHAIFSLIRWTPYLIPALLLGYVIAAEHNWPLPGGLWTRDYLYVNHMSVSRPIISDLDILKAAEDARRDLIQLMLKRWQSGWFQPLVSGPITHENWINAQAAAAVLHAPEAQQDAVSESRLSLQQLQTQFVKDPQGAPYGWLPNESAKYTSAEPLLWATAAYAAAWAYLDDASQERMVPTLNELNTSTRLFRMCDGRTTVCGWNMFPNMEDPTKHSTYSTALALAALLDLRAAKIPWMEGEAHFTPAGHERLQRLIAATAAYLAQTFQRGKPSGWRPSSALPGPVDDGLTFQVFAVLLRARREAGVNVPDEIVNAVPARVGELVNIFSDRPTYSTWSWSGHALRNHRGERVTSETPDFRYLWYPWALECAYEWLRFADDHPQRMADVVRVRRARDHLFMDELRRAVSTSKNAMTFVGAETLYCLADIPRAGDSGERRSKGSS